VGEVGRWANVFLMGKYVKKINDLNSMHALGLVTWMGSNSSKMELVQSWRLRHSSPIKGALLVPITNFNYPITIKKSRCMHHGSHVGVAENMGLKHTLMHMFHMFYVG
jgi:hypothetical protein